jgi:hypothetical protein
MINGQYQLDLPWSEGHRSKVQLLDSSAMAFSRAKRFGVKMKREPETWKMVQNAMKEYEEEGFGGMVMKAFSSFAYCSDQYYRYRNWISLVFNH